MATFLVILIVSASAAGVAQETNSDINLGASLTPTSDPWLSPSGMYAFGFFTQGNGYAVGIYLAGIHEKTVAWTANSKDPLIPANVTLSLSREGLFIPLKTGRINISNATSEYVASASMLDNGNFVLYNSDRKIVWESFEYPTDTLLPGQHLTPGQELISSASRADYSRGNFRLKMQSDGNLVQYPVKTQDIAEHAYYATDTMGAGDNITFNLGDDGQMYLLNSSSKIIKNITQGGYPKGKGIYLVRIDADGILRLYFHSLDRQANWSIAWSSTENVCVPKGICGLNAFCDPIDNKTVCTCLPGFDAINSTDSKLSCRRIFGLESCNTKGTNLTFEMRTLKNVVWENNQYDSVETNSTDGCIKACVEDCLCEAALFNTEGGNCLKQKLPLMYGRRLPPSNLIGFTKVAITPENPSAQQKKQSKKGMPVFGIVIIVVSAVAFASLLLWFSYRRRKNYFRDTGKLTGLERLEVGETGDDEVPLVSFSSILTATDHFSDENKLGQGGFGPVYKAKLASGQEIAVKRLLKISGQGVEQFRNEVLLISKLQHRNLVKLLGYCTQGDEKILVYEYLPNKGLDSILFDVAKRSLLNWTTRLCIIEGVAQGLLYLHRYSRVTIIHRDLKASNILLDDNMNPKISDFGTARIFEDGQSLASTSRIFGTYGYMSPEYAMDGHFSVKSDVFSFGVVVLEIISGQRNSGFSRPDRPLNLIGYTWNLWVEGRVSELIDPILIEPPPANQFIRCVQIGLLCVQEVDADRPTMSDVIYMLTNESMVLPNPNKPAFYATFDLKKRITFEDTSSSSVNQLTISKLQGR